MSQQFTTTRKEVSDEEVSINAQLLTRAGFVEKVQAGVYAFLPLGLRVMRKIEEIVREEMNAAGGQEMLMPALHPKEYWEATGRWDDLDVLFQLPSRHGGRKYALGASHEEVVVPLALKFIHSYRDLPQYVYQIQTKFRDEPRAKSGILRGREFVMKDLYSFHTNEDDMHAYYEVMKKAYARVFERCGLDAIQTEASGGSFSEFSHEYQVVTDSGEDIIFTCACGYAVNREISDVKKGDDCPKCGAEKIDEQKAIEVGNIFSLHRKYSDPFKLTYTDEKGKQLPVFMGCYGIGISRLMGSIVEVHHDEKGIVWPSSVSPFDVHVVQIGDGDDVTAAAEDFVARCEAAGLTCLYDDRTLSPGASLGDADLMGAPKRVVVSSRSLKASGVELSDRASGEGNMMSVDDALAQLI